MKQLLVIVLLFAIAVLLGSARDKYWVNRDLMQSGEANFSEMQGSGSQEVEADQEDIHYHAGFIVYEDGQRVDLSVWKYMHIEPCGEEHEEGPETEQEEKAHLHDSVGDVVHVHRSGAVWSDLFVNIGYEIDENVVGYVDGQSVEDILSKPIVEGESVLFVTGSDEGVDLKQSVSDERIQEVSMMSESCGE